MAVAKRISKTDRIFSLSIIFLPFLYQYRGLGKIISFGEMLLALSVALIFFKDRFILKRYDRTLLAFYSVSLLSTFLNIGSSHFDIMAASTVIARMILYGVVILFARKHFHIQYVQKIYILFVSILSLYLILQYFYFYATQNYLPIHFGYSLLFPPEARAENLAEYYKDAFRPSSFFLEASYFALYVLPAVCMLVFKNEKDKKEKYALVLICVALVLSTASSGIVGLGLILTVYFFKQINSKNLLKKKLFATILVGIGIVSFLVLAENSEFILNRLAAGGSINYRITRGIIIYADLPEYNKVFGLGLNNIESYMLKHSFVTPYDEGESLNYCSSIMQTLNFSGIVGLVLLIMVFISQARKIKGVLKTRRQTQITYNGNAMISLFCILLFVTCYEAILFSYRFAFFMCVLEGLRNLYVRECKMVEKQV